MAPKRKQTNADNSAAVAAPTDRVTRSSTRRANATFSPPAAEPEPNKRKKAKTTSSSSSASAAAANKAEGEARLPPASEEQSPVSEPEVLDGAKTIVIEHCKQCNSFKTRAILVKDGLEKGVPGVNVVVNPEKPRRGCFEIREQNGEIFVSLLDMKRPFRPMKELDMDKVVSDIVEKIR